MNFPTSLLNKIKSAPLSPGCYIYRNKNNKVLYIGKAINLRNRTNSYFTNFERLDPKIQALIAQVKDVEFIKTDSELEALILETNLIKKYKPKYNRMMKDDKNYIWLMVTKSEDYPRIEIVRQKKIKSADYFGPFPNPKPIRNALKMLRKIFPFRSCNREIYFKKSKSGKKKFHSSNSKPCLYFHLNLCEAPCTGNIKRKIYRKNINSIKHFFRSQKFKVVEELKKEMNKYSQDLEFEKAVGIRNKLEDLEYIVQRIRVEYKMDEFLWKRKKEKTQKQSLKKLLLKLKLIKSGYQIPATGYRIECYDISNISGKSATGSMVVFIDGKPDKSQYRKFKIKTKEEPDDYLMLREVFKRRFKKSSKRVQTSMSEPTKDRSFSILPDLIIVDGGKGQLSSALRVLNKLKINIPVIGLAKREEKIITANSKKHIANRKSFDFKTIKLPRGSNELFLIQRIRDEAHRFAIKYHRLLRSKKQVLSILDNVPGVGKVIRKRLLKAFGSAGGIKRASTDELQSVVKNKRTVENLKKLL